MSTEILTAIVLGAVNLGESDRLMRLLTRERGQVTARARGARKSRKRYGGKLDRYCLIRAHLRIRRDRAALGDVDLLQPFLGVREDLVRAAMADHLLELVRIVAREEEPAAELFGLTVRALTTLDAGPTPPEGWLHAVALELMRLSGVALSLAQAEAVPAFAAHGQHGQGRQQDPHVSKHHSLLGARRSRVADQDSPPERSCPPWEPAAPPPVLMSWCLGLVQIPRVSSCLRPGGPPARDHDIRINTSTACTGRSPGTGTGRSRPRCSTCR